MKLATLVDENGHSLSHNNRPMQPLYNRKVTYFYPNSAAGIQATTSPATDTQQAVIDPELVANAVTYYSAMFWKFLLNCLNGNGCYRFD